MTRVRAWAAYRSGDYVEPFEYQFGAIEDFDVEVAVEHCGICYSDLAVMNSEWGASRYPVVPGHEVIGMVSKVGDAVRRVRVGQRVGIGWWADCCAQCDRCMQGQQNFCSTRKPTIVGRHGGFASHVRAHASFCTPIPEGLDPTSAGPLMCGGLTVFSPLLTHDVKPIHRVGVVGIGGLGHMAIGFCRAWGCEVVALTSSEAKCPEAIAMGAHTAVVHTDAGALAGLAGSLDFLFLTARGPVDWDRMIQTLAPDGRMHLVGVPNQAIPIDVRPHLIISRRSVSGSSTGSPSTVSSLLTFAARHGIAPRVETFPMRRVNDAIRHLRSGAARYRVVLEADFA